MTVKKSLKRSNKSMHVLFDLALLRSVKALSYLVVVHALVDEYTEYTKSAKKWLKEHQAALI